MWLGSKAWSIFKGPEEVGFRQTGSVQLSSVTQSCLTLCDTMNHSMPGLPVHHNSQSSPKPMSIESVIPSNHLILCRPLLLLPSIFPSIRLRRDNLCTSFKTVP
ncbi:unnamed protein product [Rangifer tarandus platyrhynchus]|uniref:Uncharacterized protein n=1 Tax=Rangifer tarandus platyrhynchus TaxID=3082113 RepID=A0ACB1MJU2_RANTA